MNKGKNTTLVINSCINCYTSFSGNVDKCPNCGKNPDVTIPEHHDIIKLWWDFTDSGRGWLRVMYYLGGFYFTPDPSYNHFIGWDKSAFIGRNYAHVPPEVK